MRRELYGIVNVSDAFTNDGQSSLPWQAPERARLATIGSTLLNTLADSTPILKDIRVNNRLRETAESADSGLSETEGQALSAYTKLQGKDTLISIATVVGGFAALVGYMVHIGVFSAPEAEAEEEENEFAIPESVDAGDFLGSLRAQG
jgi:sorting and assembly machinery component 37